MSEREAAPAKADTIVGISFGDAFRAQEFLTASHRLMSLHDVELLDAVVIAKDASGKTTVRETVDPSPASSAVRGGVWTGLLGLFLAGPIGWLAGTAVGAGAGAVRAKIVDVGVPDEWVAWFREAVHRDTVTVVLLLGKLDRAAVLAELERFAGARLVYANVEPDVVQRIREALGDPSTGPLTQAADAAPAGPLTQPADAATAGPTVVSPSGEGERS